MMSSSRSRRGRKRRTPVPLHYRVPNPPALFTGREEEHAWLVASLERGPVSVISGPGGVGKTALVRYTLHKRFPRKLGQVINIEVPPMEPLAQVRLQVLRALAEASGETAIDWSGLQGSSAISFDMMLKLSESGSFWILFDDLYQDDIEEADKLLQQLASYATRSRWIVTSRRTPTLHHLAGQVWTLAGLGEVALYDLAHSWSPGIEEVAARSAVVEAAGSPWMLYQRLVTPSPSIADGNASPLAALTTDALTFLRLLSLFDGSVSLPLLETLTIVPAPEDLEALTRRGLIDKGPAGLKLHDVARKLVRAGNGGERFRTEARRIVDVIQSLDDPPMLLEAARLLTELECETELEALLSAQGARILSFGYAPRLWSVLKRNDSPRFDDWRLRCAVELGNPTALGQVRAPTGAEPTERLAWTRTLLAEGDIEGALEEVARFLSLATSDSGGEVAKADTTIEAVLLKADALELMGRSAEALAVLERLTKAEGSWRDHIDALRVHASISSGSIPRIDLSILIRRALDNPADIDLSTRVGEVLVEIGSFEDALRVVAAARATPRGALARLFSSRRLTLLAARIALSQGQLEQAKSLIDSVRPYARGVCLLLPQMRVLDTKAKIICGELTELVPQLEAWQAEAKGVDAKADAELKTLRSHLGMILAEEPEVAALDLDQRAPNSRRYAAWGQIWAARWGGRVQRQINPLSRTSWIDPRQSILDDLGEATEALVHDDAATASIRALGAERGAERRGFTVLRAEALCLVADTLISAGRNEELAFTAQLLEHLSAKMTSRRMHDEARFFAAVATGNLRPALLERLAGALHVAPVAARRSRVLLGSVSTLDLLDQRVLEALMRNPIIPKIETVSPNAVDLAAPWQPGWGVDERNEQVWFEDGSSIELDGSGLSLKILVALLDRGGEATKESLVLHAWGEREYHPLRHDGKLRVAVLKLRELLSANRSNVERVLTTETGYRLINPVRRVKKFSAFSSTSSSGRIREG